MAEHNEIGIAGEAKARQYLMEEGYLILETNWRWHRNELDIIAQKDQTLVVVEVKVVPRIFFWRPKMLSTIGRSGASSRLRMPICRCIR